MIDFNFVCKFSLILIYPFSSLRHVNENVLHNKNDPYTIKKSKTKQLNWNLKHAANFIQRGKKQTML